MSSAPSSSLPPLGDPTKAETYITRLVRLIEKDKATVYQTDLDKFDLTTMQNHYRVDLGEYDVEVSHSIQPDTDKDFYTIIFNSIRKIQDGSSNKVILAYIHINEDQYRKFKISADEALERQKRKDDAVRFVEVMKPLDNVFNSLDPEGQILDHNNSPLRLDVVPDETISNRNPFIQTSSTDAPHIENTEEEKDKLANPFDQN
jgi:hypothetical protein